jgi:hypothetical protein
MSIQLNVEIQEAQQILNALADQPFKQIADLWFKVKTQAEQQLAAQQAAANQAPAPEPSTTNQEA